MDRNKQNNGRQKTANFFKEYGIADELIDKYTKASSDLRFDIKELEPLIKKYKENFGLESKHYIQGALIQSLGLAKSFDEFRDTQLILFENGVNRRLLIPWFVRTLESGKVRKNEISLTNKHIQGAIVWGADLENTLMNLENHSRSISGLELFEDYVVSNVRMGETDKNSVIRSLSKETTEIKRVAITRGLLYAVTNPDSVETLSAIIKHKDWDKQIEVFPFIDILSKREVISTVERKAILASDDAQSQLSTALRGKIPTIFGIEAKNNESSSAVRNNDFVNDLFILYSVYKDYSVPAFEVLTDLTKTYLESGVSGVKQSKLSPLNAEIRDKISRLDTYEAYSDRNVISYSQIAPNVDAYLANRKKEENMIGEIANTLGLEKVELVKEIKEEIKLTKSDPNRLVLEEILTKLSEENANALKEMKLSSKMDKWRNRAMGLIETLRFPQMLTGLDETVSQLSEIPKLPKDKQEDKLMAIRRERRDEMNDFRYGLFHTSNMLAKSNIKVEFIEDFKSLYSTLFAKSDEEDRIKAKISFDLADGITIGRFGESGQGSCFRSTSPVSYNRSLMNFLGDPYEFQVLFTLNEKKIGFMPLHLILTDNKEQSFFLETNMAYLDDRKLLDRARKAAERLMIGIYAQEGVATYDPYVKGREVELYIPQSKVPHYIDFLKYQGQTDELRVRVSASKLGVSDLRNMKRDEL